MWAYKIIAHPSQAIIKSSIELFHNKVSSIKLVPDTVAHMDTMELKHQIGCICQF